MIVIPLLLLYFPAGDDCDFEGSDLCGWRNSYRSTLDWLRRSGPTPTANTGPQTDHTTQSHTGEILPNIIKTMMSHGYVGAEGGPRSNIDFGKHVSVAYFSKCRMLIFIQAMSHVAIFLSPCRPLELKKNNMSTCRF